MVNVLFDKSAKKNMIFLWLDFFIIYLFTIMSDINLWNDQVLYNEDHAQKLIAKLQSLNCAQIASILLQDPTYKAYMEQNEEFKYDIEKIQKEKEGWRVIFPDGLTESIINGKDFEDPNEAPQWDAGHRTKGFTIINKMPAWKPYLRHLKCKTPGWSTIKIPIVTYKTSTQGTESIITGWVHGEEPWPVLSIAKMIKEWNLEKLIVNGVVHLIPAVYAEALKRRVRKTTYADVNRSIIMPNTTQWEKRKKNIKDRREPDRKSQIGAVIGAALAKFLHFNGEKCLDLHNTDDAWVYGKWGTSEDNKKIRPYALTDDPELMGWFGMPTLLWVSDWCPTSTDGFMNAGYGKWIQSGWICIEQGPFSDPNVEWGIQAIKDFLEMTGNSSWSKQQGKETICNGEKYYHTTDYNYSYRFSYDFAPVKEWDILWYALDPQTNEVDKQQPIVAAKTWFLIRFLPNRYGEWSYTIATEINDIKTYLQQKNKKA